MAWGLLAVAILVVVGLSLYALRLWREVKRREAFKRDEINRANQQCLESLDAIAKAMLDDQVDLTEGALRCKVLLEIIDPDLTDQDRFRVFAETYARTSHLHTHSSRLALSPRDRMKEDRERLAIESELDATIREAAREILAFRANWLSREVNTS
ncbi:Protein of unknown function [Aidingimonas halophila]|uniref:DUF2489 domain-containing protein n=2 Tax=Aidingimonas halophila TaxID=574349 RepID=A0A1H3BZN2_9GAMM|nr:hypothetical protein GCM10008094_18620 [Aidingimonas halophila]SDX46709.1 Protein of unknown function [Aidingimonas halophila]